MGERVLLQRLDRTRPLWEVCLVEGLAGNRWALATKTHHCMVDGVGSVDVAYVMLDDSPRAHPRRLRRATSRTSKADSRRVPAALGPSGERDRAGSPRRRGAASDRLQGRRARAATGQGALEIARSPHQALGGAARGAGAGRGDRPRRADRGAADEPQRPDRRKATARGSEDPAHRGQGAQERAGRHRQRRRPRAHRQMDGVRCLRAGRSLRPRGCGRWSRSTSDCRRAAGARQQDQLLFVALPVAGEDPLERFKAQVSEAESLKSGSGALGAATMIDVSSVAPPMLHSALARSMYATRLFNLTITNVPGPQQPLYALGSRMREVG